MQIKHELPKRLRFKAKSLYDSRLYPEFIENLREEVSGIELIQANPRSKSLIIKYSGNLEVRQKIIAKIANTKADCRARYIEEDEASYYFNQAVLAAGTLALSSILPQWIKILSTGILVAEPLLDGVVALIEKRKVNTEVLDAMALGVSVFRQDYMTAVATRMLTCVGEYLEATTTQTSNDMLQRLLISTPGTAWIKQENGETIEIPASKVKEEDIVFVSAGNMIPIDGQIIEGSATINQASITGESVPVDKEIGAQVLSGSVVEDGSIYIRAVRVGNSTTTARITKFITQALKEKPTIQTSAEKLADRRVYLTLGMGALTFLVTRNLSRVASVLLIDYSCALKLGAPVAIKSALYKAAKAGILMKGGVGIESLSEVDTVVFDKTGTLTHGKLEVSDVIPLGAVKDKKYLLSLIASLEEHTTHPVADAIVAEAKEENLSHINHDHVEFIVAHGLVSHIDGKRVVIGSKHFLRDHEGVDFEVFKDSAQKLDEEGKLILYAAKDKKAIGLVGLRDHLRAEAKQVIDELYASGVKDVVLLTGDTNLKANALAKELGISKVYAECEPEDKAKIVQILQKEGRKVAFVGDGVNDAPALVAADIGIAMPKGADLARATADIVLMQDSVLGVSKAREISQETIKLIKSNFNWAIGLNTGLYFIAMSGTISPVLSSVLHNSITISTLIRGLTAAR